MKKIFLMSIISAFISLSAAQNVDYVSYGKNVPEVLNLSVEQKMRIQKLNREVGAKFQAIGRSNIPGYEKGQRKRALALEHKAAIREILTENQINTWENYHGYMSQGDGLRDIIKDDYDIRLELLEKKYEQDEEIIEESSMCKDMKKEKLDELKKAYKKEKERLKAERDIAVKYGLPGK